MSDPSLELQAALIGNLKSDPDVQAVVGNRVYYLVPMNPTLPYISLGDNQVLPDKADCIDGVELFWQIDGWTTSHEQPEEKAISKAVVAALDDQPLAISGYDAVVVEIDRIDYLRDPDGITRHVAISFRFLIQAL
jgi:Protein of unknown function (DUF3168)